MMMFISATSKIVKDYCDEQSIRGKDHYMTDLLYDWFGFKQTSKTVLIR